MDHYKGKSYDAINSTGVGDYTHIKKTIHSVGKLVGWLRFNGAFTQKSDIVT